MPSPIIDTGFLTSLFGRSPEGGEEREPLTAVGRLSRGRVALRSARAVRRGGGHGCNLRLTRAVARRRRNGILDGRHRRGCWLGRNRRRGGDGPLPNPRCLETRVAPTALWQPLRQKVLGERLRRFGRRS